MSAISPDILQALANQAYAADPSASVFVRANAGSGKTKVLVDRVARLLLEGAAPDAIICITFTKAAAAEMQTRLFDRLGSWSVLSDADLSEKLAALLARDAAAIGPRDLSSARRLFARALETPGGLKIQTIHALCERILRRFPLEAGLTPGFVVLEDAAQAQLRATAWAKIGALAAEGEAEIAGAFAHVALAFGTDDLADLLANALRHRRAIVDFWQKQGGLDEAQTALWRHFGFAGPRSRADLLAPWFANLPRAELAAAAGWLASGKITDQKTAEILQKALAGDAETAFAALLSLAFTTEGEPRAKPVFTADMRKFPRVEALLRLDSAFIAEVCALESALEARDAAQTNSSLFLLAIVMIAEVEAAKMAAQAVDFDDLIDRAADLLDRADLRAWVQFKLDAGIAHVLVDEAQDTSPSQWRLIRALTAEFFVGDAARPGPRTLFAVGDEKQSIYGFQGADPAGFLREGQDLITRATAAGMVAKALPLDVSFRSCPEILAAVDHVVNFTPISAPPAGADLTTHIAFRQNDRGGVELWAPEPPPVQEQDDPWDLPVDAERADSAEARLGRRIAARLQDWFAKGLAIEENAKKRGARPGDVLILVRKRGKVATAVLRALKRAGIPVAGRDRFSLADEIAVQDVLSLAKAALDPFDDLALAEALHSPLLGLSLEAIFTLAHDRGDAPLSARLIAAAATDPKFAFAASMLQRAQAIARASGAHHFCAWALEQADPDGKTGWARMIARLSAEAREPLEELLSQALAFDQGARPGLLGFIREIGASEQEIKRELSSNSDSVRLMTVHGAKGLEAPIVILADATERGARNKRSFILTEDGAPILSPLAKASDPASQALRAQLETAEAEEYGRLLYVGMTRARDRLVIAGRAGKEGKIDAAAWHRRVDDALRDHWVKAGAADLSAAAPDRLYGAAPEFLGPPLASIGQSFGQLPNWARATNAWRGPNRAPSEAGLSPLAAGAPLRFRRGAIVHALLQHLPAVEAVERPVAGARLAQALGADLGPELRAALVDEARRILNDPQFAPAFAPGSRAEVTLFGIGAQGGPARLMRLDRLAVTPARVYLVDFKTNRPPPARLEEVEAAVLLQLADYCNALQSIYPDRAIESALIWTDSAQLMPVPHDYLKSAVMAAGAA